MVKIACCGKTDIGLRRSNNEDAIVIVPDLGLLTVADGMGGAASGELASKIFAETALNVLSKTERHSKQETFESVRRVFQLANERILSISRNNYHHNGMGCTAELMAIYQKTFVLGHVGDSRTYHFRQSKLRRITRDHTPVQDQIDNGIITADEAKKHFKRNVILRAVGVNEMLEVDFITGECLTGDLFLLCSDGLTNMVDDSVIEKVLSSSEKSTKKVDNLINLSKAAGGYDNITVALCEVLS